MAAQEVGQHLLAQGHAATLGRLQKDLTHPRLVERLQGKRFTDIEKFVKEGGGLLVIAGPDSAKGSARAFTGASPSARRATIARRVGSASAAKRGDRSWCSTGMDYLMVI